MPMNVRYFRCFNYLCNFYGFVSCFQEFGRRDDDSAVILNKEVAETVTELLGLESVDDLSFALTILRTVTRGIIHRL